MTNVYINDSMIGANGTEMEIKGLKAQGKGAKLRGGGLARLLK